MKRNVSEYEFCDAFRDMGRGDSFSYEGLKALYDHLLQYEEDTGEEIELDVISLCCDYSEYDTALEAAQEYGFELDSEKDESKGHLSSGKGRRCGDNSSGFPIDTAQALAILGAS